MKELSIEEKAKRYDEIREKARKEYSIHEVNNAIGIMDALERVFPEFKESEDEKILRHLKAVVKEYDMWTERGLSMNDVLAWLEKQGEKKSIWHNEDEEPQRGSLILLVMQSGTPIVAKIIEPNHTFNHGERWAYIDDLLEKKGGQKSADEVEPKFHEGDWVIDKQGIVHQVANVIENVTYRTYGYDTVGGGYFNDNTEGVRLWTIQDAKDGDVLVASDGSIFLFKCTINCACKHYVALTTDGVVKFNKGLKHYWETSTAVHPSTKEQRDTLIKAIADAGYTFDFEKKELKKIEQKPQRIVSAEAKESMYDKPAWSEDDQSNFNELGSFIFETYRTEDASRLITWLKYIKDRVQLQNIAYYNPYKEVVESITTMFQHYDRMDAGSLQDFYDNVKVKCKDAKEYDSLFSQPTWKPSDEQMKVLEFFIPYVTECNIVLQKSKDTLLSLLSDLKKLREK